MSVKLPHQLAPWHVQLRIFPEEIALALGPMVQKLAALVGPFGHHHVEGHVVPDGFAGLAKRGSYDRLISSDWLLAEELPEEFMRRSVMGEHLFWKLAYREPVQSRSSLVLFDAGPHQLGSPRLLHVAALVVFDARARSAKANFQWGILQCPEEGALPGVSFGEVEVLLGARGSVTATRQHLAAWLRHAADKQGGEVWAIGSRPLRTFLPETVSSLVIADLPVPGERRLRAECRPAGKHSRAIELELPSPAACAQLLRDPFSAAIARRRKLDTDSALTSLVFNPPGNRLWVQTAKGGLIVFSVPNSPRETAGKPKHYETLSRFSHVSVGRIGRSTLLISIDPVSLTLRVSRFGKTLPPGLAEGEYEFLHARTRPLFQPNRLSLCVWHGVRDHKPGLYLLDEAGSLLRLFVHENGRLLCEVMHSHALALTHLRSGMCYAAYEPRHGGQIQVFAGNHLASPVQSWPSAEAPARAFFGHGPLRDSSSDGLCAFGYGYTTWKICSRNSQTEVNVPQGFSVYGVIQVENYEETLIVVEEDSQTLSLHGSHGTRRLVKAQSPIVAVSGCRQLPFIAYATASGEISVYSIKHGKAALDFVRSAT
jgi:hypothetical protein